MFRVFHGPLEFLSALDAAKIVALPYPANFDQYCSRISPYCFCFLDFHILRLQGTPHAHPTYDKLDQTNLRVTEPSYLEIYADDDTSN